ncbi:DUF3099 domain-containing protein [Streptomyces sp. NPDC058953]|uniref:DUF3099 domain-containing protein n=1 Tax=unclassified Streptomyces TaxID=2593676 RepID=UPI0036ABD4ED
MRQRVGTEVFRITGARQGLTEDVRGRQRRYIVSMTVRTVSFVAAAVLWNVQRPVAIVAIVLGMLLPYVAVVLANAGREKPPALPSTFALPAVPAALGPGSAAGAGPAAGDRSQGSATAGKTSDQ